MREPCLQHGSVAASTSSRSHSAHMHPQQPVHQGTATATTLPTEHAIGSTAEARAANVNKQPQPHETSNQRSVDERDQRWDWNLEPPAASTSQIGITSAKNHKGKRVDREDSLELVSDHPSKAPKVEWAHLTDFTTVCKGLKFHKGKQADCSTLGEQSCSVWIWTLAVCRSGRAGANTVKLNTSLTLERNRANYDKNCIMAFNKGEKTGYLPPGICSKLVCSSRFYFPVARGSSPDTFACDPIRHL